jgi:hypothetical protein
LVRTGVRSISTGIVALSIWFAVKSVGTHETEPGEAGLQAELGYSILGTIHPKRLDLRLSLGSEILNSPGARLASLESEDASDLTLEEQEAQSEPAVFTRPCASFAERFFFDERFASFDQRFPGMAVSLDGSPAGIAGTGEQANDALPPAPDVSGSARPFTSSPRLRITDAPADSNSPLDVDSHTAVYDIAAHTVYLPSGRTLEAHSGLGARQDDPHYVNARGRGPTPPNVYHLTLREHLFHGVRALRLIPVDDERMFGRDGILAHSYMLGPSGQSNGCVSFSNYPAFLKAYLNGEVERLVVVDHLATAPGAKTASRWLSRILKDRSTRS